jgi:3-deoxy-D-manno-octulosonate 8-phosphate phosphatase (KDO 8-P phosphatase)
MREINERAARIRLVVFDVDGVLTDGSLFIDADGRELKAFHSRDGHGMKMLQQSGVDIGIITGRTSTVVDHRMSNLGVKYVYQGQEEKLPAFVELIEKLGLGPEQVAYVGDDVVDLPIMCRVGLAIAVQDAHELVRQHAHWHTVQPGGRGAAREVCEFIMAAQGTLDAILQAYLAPSV